MKMILVICHMYVLLYDLAGISSQIVEPTLRLPNGEIRGKIESYYDRPITTFKGIPYAKPPTEFRRLKEPEKHEGWSSTLEASKFGQKCPQLDSLGKMTGEEDCLYINVFTPFVPRGEPATARNPVMVFIHGDDFVKGSADLYNPGRFAENEVVLVTFNYRLGILGFLSTGDDACPGNLGLKDQLMALQWVRDNIQYFGGDSSSVTLFGQGAGAASVFLHILSPQSKGLFHRAITQSGSPLCYWATEERPYKYAVKVARRLGCSIIKSTTAMVDCIRNKPLTEILEAQKDVETFHFNFNAYELRTVPVVEKNGFLPASPEELLNKGDFTPIPLMSGVNKDDGAIFYSLITSYEEDLKEDSSFLLNEVIPSFIFTETDIKGNRESVSQAIYFHYFNGIDPTNLTQVLQPFINMTTDSMFVSCNYKTLQLYSEKGARVYMYTFEYKGQDSMLDLELPPDTHYDGVSHGDELLYLFDVGNLRPNPSTNDLQMKRELPFLWTKFAKYGESPLDVSKKLDPYTPEHKYYFRIDSTGQTLETSYKQREVDLWLDHLPKLSKMQPDGDKKAVEHQMGGIGWAMLVVALILFIVAVVLAVLLVRKSKSQYVGTKTEDK